jgi:hypothetical protein
MAAIRTAFPVLLLCDGCEFVIEFLPCVTPGCTRQRNPVRDQITARIFPDAFSLFIVIERGWRLRIEVIFQTQIDGLDSTSGPVR